MEDIRRRDQGLFLKEIFEPTRLMMTGAVGFLFAMLVNAGAGIDWPWFLAVVSMILGAHAVTAWNASKRKRFINKRYEALWTGCKDRYTRLEEVLGKMRKEQIADLKELPRTIRSVAESLYLALRRADIISHEVHQTEAGMFSQPPTWEASAHDPQAKELYRIADKNIAEYRQQFAGVMAGVQRTEAQSAVFMTTLDTLRMKLIGYRLVGKSPEMPSYDFLSMLTEAKLQLQAIDQALEELDLGHYPKMIAAVPPPMPQPGAHEGQSEEQQQRP